MRALIALVIVFAVFAAAGPAHGQSPSLKVGKWLSVDFKARLQGDFRRSEAAIRGDDGDGIDIARRRIGVEGRVGTALGYEVEYELAGGGMWRDAFLEYRQFKKVQVRAGAFKLPFGLEETTSSTKLDFIYRTRISARLAPGRDRGVEAHGKLGVVSYEAGVFRHDGDNARPSQSARVFAGRTVAVRVVARPVRAPESRFAGLHVGAAFTRGNVPLGFPAVRARTVFGASFYDSDVLVNGARQRMGLEARWKTGRVALQSEYIRLTDERRGQSIENLDLSPLVAHGWYLSGTYNLTRKRHRLGRFDVAGRYETLSFGSAGGTGEASTSVRAERVLGNSDRVGTVGITWHVNRWVKVQANLIREDIEHPSMGPLSDRSGFWSRVFRLQFAM